MTSLRGSVSSPGKNGDYKTYLLWSFWRWSEQVLWELFTGCYSTALFYCYLLRLWLSILLYQAVSGSSKEKFRPCLTSAVLSLPKGSRWVELCDTLSLVRKEIETIIVSVGFFPLFPTPWKVYSYVFSDSPTSLIWWQELPLLLNLLHSHLFSLSDSLLSPGNATVFLFRRRWW